MTRLFDGGCHEALMFGAGAGLAARANFAVFGDVFAEDVYLFVFDDESLIRAKLAKLWLGEEPAFSAFALRGVSFTHNLLQALEGEFFFRCGGCAAFRICFRFLRLIVS